MNLAEMLRRPDWMADAACRGMDTELFYPGRGESTAEAKAVCAACTVTDECRLSALVEREKFGIWGGLSERERRAARKEIGAVGDRRVARCGTNSRYQQGCRCDDCTAARRAYMQEYRHGTRSSVEWVDWTTRDRDVAPVFVSDDPRRDAAADASEGTAPWVRGHRKETG